MQLYTSELYSRSRKIYTISTPFSNYSYNCVPMGLKILPAFEAKIEQCLPNIEEPDVCVDNVGVLRSD